jgi:NitT/TauT family transport system substrate-binding protein
MADPGAGSRRGLPWVVAGVAAIALAAAALLGRPGGGPATSTSPGGPSSAPTKPLEQLNVGVLDDGESDLVHLAVARGYFAAEGLEVHPKRFKKGRKALDGLLSGAVDLTAAGDVPVAVEAWKHPDYAVFATIAHASEQMLILARKDQGVVTVADLKGKRVGIEARMSSRYILSLFLDRHGLAEADVKVVEMKVKQLTGALARGEVAAVADGLLDKHRFLEHAAKAPGVEVVEIKEPSGYRLAVNMVATRAFIGKRPEVLRAFVRALLHADDLVRDHREDAQRSVAGALAVEGKKVAGEWKRLTFGVSLDPTLPAALEDESRWYDRSGRAPAGATRPVVASLLYPDALRAERPGAVTLAP